MASRRTCDHCGRPLACTARSDARYCSVRCRVAAHRAALEPEPLAAIPAALRERPRWVRHRAKVPLTCGNRPASVAAPETWCDFATASGSTVGDGLGFVLNGDGLVCIDLDDCLSGTHLALWAQRVLDTLPATYIERSPSGRGLHVWGMGSLDRGRRLTVDGGTVELYGNGRYLTVTGQRWRGAPADLAPLDSVVAQLLTR